MQSIISPLPPTVQQRLTLLYETHRVAPHKRRLLRYLAMNPHARTSEIARGASVGYPPSPIRQLNFRLLPDVGLTIKRIQEGSSRAAECRWLLAKSIES